MFVLIVGDLIEGVMQVVGPFDSEELADEYGDTHNLGHFERFTWELDKPEPEQPEE